MRKLLILTLCLTILFLWGSVALVQGKAMVANVLISYAWERAQENAQENVEKGESRRMKPWPWADTWPVLSLKIKRGEDVRKEHTVLQGSTGNVLAFSPGLLPESRTPGFGPVLVASHRDTYFSYLENIETGDRLLLENINGRQFHYVVEEFMVIDTEKEVLEVSESDNSLYLLTCFPFRALNPGGPLRYVVRAKYIGNHDFVQI